jgi:hypothetical protein
MANPMVQEQRAFMRSVVGARSPTMISLYRELAQRPLQYHWANLALRFGTRWLRGRAPRVCC